MVPVGMAVQFRYAWCAAAAGAPGGSGKALKPSRMSSQGLFAMGVMQVRARLPWMQCSLVLPYVVLQGLMGCW